MTTMTRRSLAVLAAALIVVPLTALFLVTAAAKAPASLDVAEGQSRAVDVGAQEASKLRAPTFDVDPKWPTIPNNSLARARAFFGSTPCAIGPSLMICPTLRRGLSEANGS